MRVVLLHELPERLEPRPARTQMSCDFDEKKLSKTFEQNANATMGETLPKGEYKIARCDVSGDAARKPSGYSQPNINSIF